MWSCLVVEISHRRVDSDETDVYRELDDYAGDEFLTHCSSSSKPKLTASVFGHFVGYIFHAVA